MIGSGNDSGMRTGTGTGNGALVIGLGGSRVARLAETAEALAAELSVPPGEILSAYDYPIRAGRPAFDEMADGPSGCDLPRFLEALASRRGSLVLAVLGPLAALESVRKACDLVVFIEVEERLSLLRWADLLMEAGAPGGVEALLRHAASIAPEYGTWSPAALRLADISLDDEDGPSALASKIAWFSRGYGSRPATAPSERRAPRRTVSASASSFLSRARPGAVALSSGKEEERRFRRAEDAEARLDYLRALELRLTRTRGPNRAAFAWRQFLAERVYPAAKRSLDFTAVCLVLFVAWPVYALVAFLIWSSDPGPVIYVQKRVGKHGKLFPFPKFRSMVLDADRLKDKLLAKNEMAGGVIFKMKRDPRIIPVGFVLRKYSLDELPQLWSILRGDLTLVGPRPPVPREVALYSSSDRRRLESTPGLTCIWQVSGRSDIPFPRQVELDVEYLEQRSLLLDLKILAATVPAVVTARGAY